MRIPVVHDLKTSPIYFADVDSRLKNFEIRKNDRNFKVGDVLFLREYKRFSLAHSGFTGRTCTRIVSYILDDPDYVKDGFIIMGLK